MGSFVFRRKFRALALLSWRSAFGLQSGRGPGAAGPPAPAAWPFCPRSADRGSHGSCSHRNRRSTATADLASSARVIIESNLRASVRRHRRALAIVARLLSQDHFSEKADMVACSALNSFEERAPNTGELNNMAVGFKATWHLCSELFSTLHALARTDHLVESRGSNRFGRHG
jgi:hypothetical protein